MSEPTRLFVGNLPEGVNDEELRKEFAFYGLVKNVEIKQKKGLGEDASANSFAFVTVEADIQSINKCIHEFSEQQWKGNFLKISVARESFMEKLKRERAEESAKKKDQGQSATDSALNVKPIIINEVHLAKADALKKIKKESAEINGYSKYPPHNDNSFSEKSYKNNFESSYSEPYIDDKEIPDPSFNIINNKLKAFNGKKFPLKIDNGLKNATTEDLPVAKAKPALTPADEKRLKAMQNMRSAYQEKKSQVKIALAHVDKKANNKIVFDDEGKKVEEQNHTPGKVKLGKHKAKNTNNYAAENSFSQKKKKNELFDDDEGEDEDDGINFEVKEQFQGEAGQKLLELQARFKSDKRFVLDKRFMDEAEEPQEEGDNADDDIEVADDDEKTRQIQILQGILGTVVNRPGRANNTNDPNSKKMPIKTMLRFDPTRPDHDKFMNKVEKVDPSSKRTKKEKKRDKLIEMNEKSKPEETVVPEVSQERYYQVNESLKQSMEEKQPFSLLSMFGSRDVEESDKNVDSEYATKKLSKKEQMGKNPMDADAKNPFFYDTSDSEDEDKKKDVETVQAQPEGNAEIKPLLITEKLFFTKDDPRLKEGLEFFLDTKSSHRTREELKYIIKKRIQNNLRNDKFHFKKLPRKPKY